MVRILLLIFIASIAYSQSFKQPAVSQNGTKKMVTINTKVDTVIKKKKLKRLENKISALRYELKSLKKEVRKSIGSGVIKKNEKLALVKVSNGMRRVYYVICASDTAGVMSEYSFYDPMKWNASRASIDSTCRVIESMLNEDQVEEVKEAFEKGLIKQYGVWPNEMRRFREWLNNPINNFTRGE